MTDKQRREEVHRLVSDQYDRYPYPAAQPNLADFIGRKSCQAGCPSQFFHLYWPFREKRLDLDILVAGCGTMQAPKFALNLPRARIYSPMHQFSDIGCMLDEAEMALFGLSDNRLTIGEIQAATATGHAGLADDDVVREFYRKMFDYDYLSFRGQGSTG